METTNNMETTFISYDKISTHKGIHEYSFEYVLKHPESTWIVHNNYDENKVTDEILLKTYKFIKWYPNLYIDKLSIKQLIEHKEIFNDEYGYDLIAFLKYFVVKYGILIDVLTTIFPGCEFKNGKIYKFNDEQNIQYMMYKNNYCDLTNLDDESEIKVDNNGNIFLIIEDDNYNGDFTSKYYYKIFDV